MSCLGGVRSMCKAMSQCAVEQREQGNDETADMLQAAIQRIVDVNMAKVPPPTTFVKAVMDAIAAQGDAAGTDADTSARQPD